jgi:hypothetical protein
MTNAAGYSLFAFGFWPDTLGAVPSFDRKMALSKEGCCQGVGYTVG